MLEKWKQRAMQMNFKKAILIFLAVSFIPASNEPSSRTCAGL